MAIHAANIVHRDIKPNNIMLDGTGASLRLWITDFGLARAYQNETTVSEKGSVDGTPGYIAPELLKGHAPSAASDLFALGVVLHELFTGGKPTQSPDGSSYTVSPRLGAPKVPVYCVRLVTGCLSADPRSRCAAFAEALAVIDPKLERKYYLSGKALLTRRRLMGVAAASVCAIAGGAWWKWDEIDELMHPLPLKRFVALLNWPKPSDIKSNPMLMGVLSSIKSRLARIEAIDRNFFVISPEEADAVIDKLPEVCGTLGANLVLAASTLPSSNNSLRMLLQLLDPLSGRSLRQKIVESDLLKITSLPDKAVEAAGALLHLSDYLRADTAVESTTQSPEAFRAFQDAEALRKDPNDKSLDAAIGKYKDAIELDSHYPAAYAGLALALGRLYALHQDPAALDLAERNCKKALNLAPNLIEGHLAHAFVLEQTGNVTAALDELTQALSIDPKNPRILVLQAQIYTRMGRWQDAEQTFNRVLEERPNYWLAHNELGVALNRQAKYPAAIKAFQAACLAAPWQCAGI